MVQETEESLCRLLESAIIYGEHIELLNFFTREDATSEDFDYIIKKLGENLDENFDFPVILDNILLCLGELLSIAELTFEQTVFLSRSLLPFSSNIQCHISNIKQVLNALNKFFEDPQVALLLVNDKSLEMDIVALGKSLFLIGDFECQTIMFEVMCRLALHDRIYWASLWFPTRKLSAKFLALKPDQFEQDSRKILNYINKKEPIPRIFSFVAKSVWLADVQLQRPQGSEFWIDLSFGSQIMSFFCSEIFNEEDDPPWETISIFADMIDNYIIRHNVEEEVTTLILQLKCSCNQLISTSSENVQFGRDEVKITFWCPNHNINRHISRLLERNYEEEKTELNENVQKDQEKRKVSISTEITTTCDDFEETEASNIKRRKSSETVDLLNVVDLRENRVKHPAQRKISKTEHLMCTFDGENDPVLPSAHRKLSEVEELVDVNQIEETNVLSKKIQKLSLSNEAIASVEIGDSEIISQKAQKLSKSDITPTINKLDKISSEQVKTAIDEVLKANRIEELNEGIVLDNEALNLPSFAALTAHVVEDLQKKGKAKRKKDFSNAEKKKLNNTEIVDMDDIHMPSLDKFPSLTSEEDSQKDTEVIKKKNSLTTKKENAMKKQIKRKQIPKHQISLEEDSGSQIVAEKNSSNKQTQRYKSSDEDFESSIMGNRKPRASAVRAIKMNKSLLHHEESGETSTYSSTIKRKNKNEDNVSVYSPKKKKIKAGSIFQSSEAQSSEFSWFKRAKKGLFQTPPLKNYTRKRIKGKNSEKKGKQQKMAQKKKDFQKISNIFECKSTDSGTKSKSLGLSDVDKFSLIVEKKIPPKLTPSKKPPMFLVELLDSLSEKGSFAASKRNLNHNFTDSEIIVKHSGPKFSEKQIFPKESRNNVGNDNQGSKVKPVSRREDVPNYKDSKTSDLKSRLESEKKINSFAKNSTNTLKNPFDTTLDDLSLALKNSLQNFPDQNKSEGDKAQSDIQQLKPLPEMCELKNEFSDASSIQYEKFDASKPSSLHDYHQTEDIELTNLSIESLSSFEELLDEENGKKLHMKLFLESLSSESPSPPSDIEEIRSKVLSKRSSYCSESANDFPSKKIKAGENQNDQANEQLRQKKSKKKTMQKSNNFSDPIVKMNRKHEQIFIQSEAKSHDPLKRQIEAKKQSRANSRLHQNAAENISNMKPLSPKEKFNLINRKHEKVFLQSEAKSHRPVKRQNEDKERNRVNSRLHQNVIENISKRKSLYLKEKLNLSHSVFTKLATEVNLLTLRLFGTLQKCTSDFRNDLSILRTNFVGKIEGMIDLNANPSEKDLKKLSLHCKENILHLQTNLEQIMEAGKIYFEAERKSEQNLKWIQRKITVKYCSHLRAAVGVAVNSIEEKIIGRARALIKKFLKEI